ncbi:hypothetical protein HHK36_004283 [Tetracentron sinense]|uniref:PHD-type domain-containing protein n=1 Tax=Tetracentron sinense TaxID=13715 RepID=A0A834ZQL7_TETSI|nr:hypothetical protein HHK36_004283 [Tetracentron sinense]
MEREDSREVSVSKRSRGRDNHMGISGFNRAFGLGSSQDLLTLGFGLIRFGPFAEMIVEERDTNGGFMDCTSLVLSVKSADSNGFAFGNGNDVADGNLGAFSVEGLRTYKRRKHTRMRSETNLQEDGVISVEAAGQLADQTMKELSDIGLRSGKQDVFSRIDIPVVLEGSDDCTHGHWRNVVLENIYQSLGVSQGGIQSCIQDALAFSSVGFTSKSKMLDATETTTWALESFHCHEDRQECHSQIGRKLDGSQNAAKEHKDATTNGAQNEPNDQADNYHITELCQRIFLDILVSEKFTLLCKLLSENFQDIKDGSFFDFSVIDSRMKEGAYEQSPILFSTDIQQAWRKFQRIGTEMVSLAESLSDMSRTSYHEQVGGLVNGFCEEGKHKEIDLVCPEQNDYLDFVTAKQFSTRGSDRHNIPEQSAACGYYKVCICRRCGAKADGRDCLVCDSCEEMYHVSCIEPAVKEIPVRSWYCSNCTASGPKSPHENCVVCKRLNDPRKYTRGGVDGNVPTGGEIVSDLEERSDCSMEAEDELQLSSGSRIHCCKLCGSEEEDGQKLRICGHPLCPSKYYHVRCLTSQQLKSYGPCWYCPSCLCRACLTDRDDERIVLCDGCDHAYHIYCMEPPRTSIPRGKWFCSRCDAGVQAICREKKAYENLEKQKTKNVQRKANKNVSVDMLLSAAEKLNSEEKLDAAKK